LLKAKGPSPIPPTTKPVSPRRLAANRANAARSTGPRSPQGKARSAQNSRQHGFTAATFAVIRLEELDAVAKLKADLFAIYQPVNSQELFAIERIALAQQALLRCARLETGLFTCCLNETLNHDASLAYCLEPDLTRDIEVTQAQNRNFALAYGFQILARKSNSLSLFLRYQAQTERLYRRAVEEFERLKALRDELPNEPIVEPESEEKTLVSPPETKPTEAPVPASPVPSPAANSTPLTRAAPPKPLSTPVGPVAPSPHPTHVIVDPQDRK
jgi:hypothetical protein